MSHICQKWINKQLAETELLVSDSTPRIHSEASKDQILCYMHLVASCSAGCPEGMQFPGVLHLQRLQYPKILKTGGVEALGTRLCIYAD